MEAFAGTHEVLALDLGGHGESTVEKEAWTVPGLADEVVAVLEGAGMEGAVVVGHSMGGWVGLAAAARAPERVAMVVGVDTLQDTDYSFPEAQADFIVAMYEADFEGSMRTFVESMIPEENPGVREAVLATAVQVQREPAMQLMRSFSTMDDPVLFQEAGVPIRCIDSKPAMVATDVEGNAAISDYDASYIEGTGHWPMLERPGEFQEHLAAWIDALP